MSSPLIPFAFPHALICRSVLALIWAIRVNWVGSSRRGSGMVKASVSSCHRFLGPHGARSPSSSNLTDSDYPPQHRYIFRRTGRTYDPGVVESEGSNNVNALFLDSLQILNVGREMPGRTAGCESSWILLTWSPGGDRVDCRSRLTWYGEQYDLLICPLF
jgi:hypothetical protein